MEGLLEKLMRERKQREADDLNRAWQNHVETGENKELAIKSLELKLKRQEAQIAEYQQREQERARKNPDADFEISAAQKKIEALEAKLQE